MNTPKRDDDDDLLIGNRAMADFSTGEGFPISVSTMQKYTSPAINTGPDLIGYYGKKPTSTKGLVRAWCRSRIRPVQSARAPALAITSPRPASAPIQEIELEQRAIRRSGEA
jgi:hypothetical protein